MTSNGPERPNRGSDFVETHNQQRDVAPVAALTNDAGDHAAPPTQRHRADSAESRWRAATIAAAIFLVLLVVAGVLVGIHLVRASHAAQPSTASPPAGIPTHAPTPTATPAPLACGVPASLLTSMPIRDKLAQLLMVGVTDAADARRVVTTQHVGGIFIASWTDLSMLTDRQLTAIAHLAGPLGLAVSVDEEGGRVERLSSLIGSAPSARVLAQTESPDYVRQLALEHGRKMRGYGITIDFAPVVDVTDAPADTVIGDRSFSPDPAKVIQYAGAYAQGLREAGVLPVLKHFPGHGHASGDSHTGGVITPSLDQLKNLDLEPYRTLVSQTPVGVMIGHMVVPDLTDGSPASLSPQAVALLRSGTGYRGPRFDGPVFTDDLSTMKAITDRYTVPDAVLKALQAGSDNALWVSDTEVPAVLDRLVAALDHHELSMANIDASVRRMATAKALSGCPH